MLPELSSGVRALQLVLTGLYIVLMLVIGWWANKVTKGNADSYMVGGRRFPTWLVVFTLFATWWCGGTAMGSTGAAYEEGLGGIIPDPFAAGLTLIIAGLFYMAILRKMKLRSMGAAYSRFGSTGVNLASGIYVYVYVLYLAVQFIGMGVVFHVILDLPIVWTTIIGSVILIFYTFLGGIVAVAWTDFVQAITIILGLVIILPISMSHAGGFKAALDTAGPDFFRSFLPSFGGKGFAHYMTYLYAWLGMGLGCITEPELLQRSFIAKDSKTARKSSIIGGAMYLTLGWIPILLGLAAISLVGKGLLPADVVANDSETIVPLIARTFLSPIPLAIFTGSLLAGLMSTGDSVLFSEAVIISNDLWPRIKRKLFKKSVSEKEILGVTQWSIIGLGLLSLVVALVMESLYDLMVYSYSLLFAMLWIPLTLGLFWKKANGPGAVAGMLGGLAVIITGMIVNMSIVPEPEWAWILGAVCVSAVLTFSVTILTQKKSPPKPLVSEDGEIVKWPELATPEMKLKPYSGEDVIGSYTIEQEVKK